MSKFQFVESDEGYCIPPPRDPGSTTFVYWYREHEEEWQEQCSDERLTVLKKHAEKLWAAMPDEEKKQVQLDFEKATFNYTQKLRDWLGLYQAQAEERKNTRHEFEEYVPEEYDERPPPDIDLANDSDDGKPCEAGVDSRQAPTSAGDTAASSSATADRAQTPQQAGANGGSAPGAASQMQQDLIQMYRDAERINEDDGVGVMNMGEAAAMTLEEMQNLKNSIMECANPIDD